MTDIERNFPSDIFSRLETNSTLKKKWPLILAGIFLIAITIRIFGIPTELPIPNDGFEYFLYATDISIFNQLPSNYTPINNGWPIFLSFFFSIFDFELTQSYMFLQRMLSIIISAATIIPIFFFCKKYLGIFYSLIGAFIFAIEPRIIQNSMLGITESLFIFLSISGFVFFLSSKKKLVYFSFVIVTLASMVRGEGVLLLIAMFVLFVIRFRKEKWVIPNTLLVISIVFLIMLPMSMYRIDIIDSDGMFMRISTSSSSFLSEKTTDERNSYVLNGLENFPKYLGWSFIPIFLVFTPIGTIIIIKQKNFDTLSIIIPSIMISISAVHAYSIPLPDTRYLFPLYPFFIIATIFGIRFFIEKSKNSKIVFFIILSSIIISSAVFLHIKSTDYEHELEAYLIDKKITSDFKKFNEFYPESRYLEFSDLPENWKDFQKLFDIQRVESVSMRKSITHNFEKISISNFNSIEEFISKNRINGLDHIVADDRETRVDFIKDIFENEENYPYLEKIYDSTNDGFNYHVKVFQINYEKYQNSEKEKIIVE